jgi:hypothetical protein
VPRKRFLTSTLQPATPSEKIPSEGEIMPKIDVSDEMHKRLLHFKQVIEAVLEEEMSLDACAEMILILGIDSMLDDLLGSLDSTVLLGSLQQLGAEYPVQVYRYIAETLEKGAAVQEQEAMRQRLGFLGSAAQTPKR